MESGAQPFRDFSCRKSLLKKSILPEEYPVSGCEDVNALLQAGKEAALALRSVNPADIANFLENLCRQYRGAAAASLLKEPHLENCVADRTPSAHG